MLFVKNVPLYRKVSSKIIELIHGGQFEGNVLPSEETMSKMLGVSRSTIREAMAELTSQGIISKRQGVGNVIMDSALNTKYRIDLKLNFAALLQEAGHQAKFIQSYSRYENLLFGHTEKTYFVYDEILLSDNRPTAFFKIHIAKDALIKIPAEDLVKNNFFEFIFDYTNEIIAHSLVFFEPKLADSTLAKLFNIQEGDPLLSWKEVFYSVNDKKICHNRIYFNPTTFKPALLRNGFEPDEIRDQVECEIRSTLR